MSNNLIFIVNIDNPAAKVRCSEYAKYSICTWEYYCKKYGIDLLILDENIGNFEFPIWNKEVCWKLATGYDKIGIVDSDTMVKWDAPNIFDQVDNGVYGVNDLCDLNWLFDSIESRQRFFPETEIDINKYINAGVLFFTNDVLPSFKNLLDFYQQNESEINQLKSGGKEQTLLNFQFVKDNVKVNLLEPSWNLISIHKKNMFQHNWQLNLNKTPYFIKYANVWHFTGFPIEQRVQVMKDTWELLKENYDS